MSVACENEACKQDWQLVSAAAAAAAAAAAVTDALSECALTDGDEKRDGMKQQNRDENVGISSR